MNDVMTFVSITTKRKISLQLKGLFIYVSCFRLVMAFTNCSIREKNLKFPSCVTEFAGIALVSLNQVIRKDAKYIRYFVYIVMVLIIVDEILISALINVQKCILEFS